MIHITEGNGKLELINSINTNPLDNEYCIKMSKKPNTVCFKCYSIRTLNRWYQVRKPLTRNSIELSETVLPMRDLPTINALYFRFNSHGELINKKHLLNLFKICRKNPKVSFALWSKRIEVFDELNMDKRPDNLVLIYSSPIVNLKSRKPREYFDKVFTVFTEDYVSENSIEINCQKKCYRCLTCYSRTTPVFIQELIK